MDKLWLDKNETMKVVETVEAITKIFGDYFFKITDEFSSPKRSPETPKPKKLGAKEEKKEESLLPDMKLVGEFFDLSKAIEGYNNVFGGLFKNTKAACFLNYFNYAISLNNVFAKAKSNPLIPDFQIDLLKNIYMDRSVDFVVDYLMHASVEDLKMNDGSLNDEFIDLVLNNVAKITKLSYKAFPDVYNDIVTKVIPGDFITSLITYKDDRNELEKVVDMFIHLSTVNLSDLSIPLSNDPFLSILSLVNPKEKKEKTIVETLGEAISKFDISGLSKVKAAGIIINRASGIYEQQKGFASDFLKQFVQSIPTTFSEGKKNIENDIDEKTEKRDGESAKKTGKNPSKAKALKPEEKAETESVKGEDDLLSLIAKSVLSGEWVNFDKMEEEISKFWK
jgi:hypothetical protein